MTVFLSHMSSLQYLSTVCEFWCRSYCRNVKSIHKHTGNIYGQSAFHVNKLLPMPSQDFNQLTGSLPAPVTNSPLVYLTAAFQVHPLCLAICSVPHVLLVNYVCIGTSHTSQYQAYLNIAGVCLTACLLLYLCLHVTVLVPTPLKRMNLLDCATTACRSSQQDFQGGVHKNSQYLRVSALQMGLLEGLSGALPPALGRLPGLTYVDLASNMLSGSLPAQLPASLQSIRLSGNMLTGTIPSSYGAHTSQSLRMYFVS